MFLIDSDGATNDNKFTDGDSGTGTPATVLPAEYLNMIQAELQAVIAAANIALEKVTNDQLLAALVSLGLRAASGSDPGVVELATTTETQAGSDSGRAVTPAGLASLTASTSRRGLVELATTTETQAGSDSVRAVTPGGMASVTATISRRGLVELATNTEAQNGTDTVRAVTPAGLQAKVDSLDIPLITEGFVSSQQAITSGGILNISHGLGVVPFIVQAELVCVVAEDGYSVGQVMPINPSHGDDGSNGSGMSIVKTSTQLQIKYGALSTVFVMVNRSTGNRAALQNGNFRLVLRAFA